MSELQAYAAGWRGAVLRRDVPGEKRSNEARAGPGRRTSTAPPRWPQAVDAPLLLALGPLCIAMPPRYVGHMQVTAISNPRHPLWRWRITDYAGELIEESRDGFATISAAVAAGTKRMVSMNVVDRSDAALPAWTVRHGWGAKGRTPS